MKKTVAILMVLIIGFTVNGIAETIENEIPNCSSNFWTKKKPVTISNTSSILNNYQINFTVDYDSDMQPDYDDLRFVDANGNILNYWIENYTDTNASIWVKIPLILAGDTTIYMHYGNPLVNSASNGKKTFIFYDDFSENTLNDYSVEHCWTDWGIGSTTHNSNNKWISVRTGDNIGECILRDVDFGTNAYIKLKFIKRRDFPYDNSQTFSVIEDDNNYYFFRWDGSYYSSQGIAKYVNGARAVNSREKGTVNSNKEYSIEMWFTPELMRLDIDGINRKNVITSDTTPISPTSFNFYHAQINDDWEMIMIGKYAFPEPGIMIGEEIKDIKYLYCRTLSLIIPDSVKEGDGILMEQGTVEIINALDTDLIINLSSDDTSEIIVPETVIIPAGYTSVNFDIDVVDDTLMDGPQLVVITADTSGYNSAETVIQINDDEGPDFTTDIASGLAPLTVNFTDQSPNNVTSWQWDFDNDGIIDSTIQNPSFTYYEEGTYSVKLIVTIGDSDYSEIKEDYITVEMDLTNGLMAYYPFNGNTNDESGNGNHGIVHEATLTTDRFCNPNSAYSFDGNDYIDVPDSGDFVFGSAPFTLSAWIQFSEYGKDGGYYLLGQSEGGGNSSKWMFWLGNSSISFIFTQPGSHWVGLGSWDFQIGQWYHVLIRRDADNLSSFVNGFPLETVTISRSVPDPVCSFRIGTVEFEGTNRWFRGKIDDIRIYNRSLSISEITEISNKFPPVFQISPDSLDFGDVLTGGLQTKSFVINNTGSSTLQVMDILSDNPAFTIFPPTQYNIGPNGPGRIVNIGFSPEEEGDSNANITIESNTCDTTTVNVTGRGIPEPGSGNIETREIIEFQNIEEGDSVGQLLTISNSGSGLLTINDAYIDNNTIFEVSAMPGDILPFTLSPDESRNLIVRFSPPEGTGNTTITGNLTIEIDDPNDPSRNIILTGNVIAPDPVRNNTVLGARVYSDTFDLINEETCNDVSGEVYFSHESTSTDIFKVKLTHQNGESIESEFLQAINGSGTSTFDGIDVCGLPDGIVNVEVVLKRGDYLFPTVEGTPAVKNTNPNLEPPVLDPIAPVSFSPIIQVCGKSRPNTTVIIEGGAYTVSADLDYETEDLCLDVPLRRNTQNLLTASAIDNLSGLPKPVASAQPVQVIYIDPSEIIISSASSRPLTREEIDELVNKGIVDPNEPGNFNISIFTIVFTVGSSQYTISEPVVTNPNHGSVSYGRGGTITGWGSPSSGGSISIPQPGSGGSGAHIFVITTPPGDGKPAMLIPGVIIIDGRIKTLKEFFQITLAIWNVSDTFDLINMHASVDLPDGLTPIRAGLGTDVSDINLNGEIENVNIGKIGPGETGIGQFIIRGDGIGTHRIDVDFEGSIAEGGLPEPIPVEGSAGTLVRVLGPPELKVLVSHPVNSSGPDVYQDDIFTLKVDITNVSNRPALYTSMELFAGGDAELVDPNGDSIPGSSELRTLGHIDPNQTVNMSFRVKSLIEGDIIACQAIAGENIILTINTGAECNIVNTVPANIIPLPADYPPSVIGINPLNGQPNIPLTTSIVAIFTPQTACIEADTWTDIETDNIDPNDPGKGVKFASGDLVKPGTFYLEELDYKGLPIRHIPTDLTVVNPPAGGTTIAVLHLGLDTPQENTQVFLKPDTTYRVTIIGGLGGVCSDPSGLEMENTFRWTFTTEKTCNELEPPMVRMNDICDGSIDFWLDRQIILSFTNRSKITGEDSPAEMDIASFIYDPNDILSSTFSVYVNGTIVDGDIQGGTSVPGSIDFNLTGDILTFTPYEGTISDGDIVYIRLTDKIRDICANPLQTPPMGVKIFHFESTKNLQIKAGWSMISLPVIPESTLVQDLFPGAVVVYGYKKGIGYVRIEKWEKLEVGKGYWILLNEEKSYPLIGQCILNYNLIVYEDPWEMIGGCSYPAQASADSCNIGVIYGYVQGYGYQRVLESESLEPGQGYWIELKDVENQCTLMVEP